MPDENRVRGWELAAWCGVLTGLLDTATPLLHPAPPESIPFGILL